MVLGALGKFSYFGLAGHANSRQIEVSFCATVDFAAFGMAGGHGMMAENQHLFIQGNEA